MVKQALNPCGDYVLERLLANSRSIHSIQAEHSPGGVVVMVVDKGHLVKLNV